MIKDFNDLLLIEEVQSTIDNLICELYLLSKETNNPELKVRSMKLVRTLRHTKFWCENQVDIELEFTEKGV